VALPEPLRGEVWDVAFPGFGVHPAVVLSVNALNSKLGHVVVLPVTGTSGPSLTHIPLGADAGRCVDVTGVQAVARGRCRRRRGLLAPSEMTRIEGQLRVYLGL
jgi:mRNA interferase MazF